MYDGLQVYFRSDEAGQMLKDEFREYLAFHGPESTGAVAKHTGKCYDCIDITIFESSPLGVKLNGSIHIFEKGNNKGLFRLRDVRKAVDRVADAFHFDSSEAKIQALEFGVNIESSHPEEVIDSAILFNGRRGKRYFEEDYYAIEWKSKRNYTVKLYKKDRNHVRYEIHFEDMRRLSHIGFHTLSDLKDRRKVLLCIKYLYESADKILFVPFDRKGWLDVAIAAKWMSYRADTYWKISKDKKYRLIKSIRNVIEHYKLDNWNSILRKEIIKQEAKNLEITPSSLRAILSQLGSRNETVAVPKRDRDRPEDDVFTAILVIVHHVVANTGWTVDVIISTLSYFPILPRGPPSSLFLSLLDIYEYNVALLIPVVCSISGIGMFPASYRARACSMALALAFGLPPFLPRARAAARPAIVLSRVRSRSN